MQRKERLCRQHRERKTKRKRSKKKHFGHLAEGRFKRERSVQGGIERREARVINTAELLLVFHKGPLCLDISACPALLIRL